MVLVERRDMIDALLKEILAKIDYWYFLPLRLFLKVDETIGPIEKKLVSFQRRLRRYLSKKYFNQVGHYTLMSCIVYRQLSHDII